MKLSWKKSKERGIVSCRASGERYDYKVHSLQHGYSLMVHAKEGYGPTTYWRRIGHYKFMYQAKNRAKWFERNMKDKKKK